MNNSLPVWSLPHNYLWRKARIVDRTNQQNEDVNTLDEEIKTNFDDTIARMRKLMETRYEIPLSGKIVGFQKMWAILSVKKMLKPIDLLGDLKLALGTPKDSNLIDFALYKQRCQQKKSMVIGSLPVTSWPDSLA